MTKDSNLLFEFSDAAMRVRDKRILNNTSWRVQKGEHWAVIGPNGSGKSTLVGALTGYVPIIHGSLLYGPILENRDRIGYVSFEMQRVVLGNDHKRDEARVFSGLSDGFETVSSFLSRKPAAIRKKDEDFGDNLARFFIEDVRLNQTLRTLSSGELRKVFIAKALLYNPALLILDEPFDGLDASSNADFGNKLKALISSGGTQIILVTHRREEVFPWITHALLVEDFQIIKRGPQDKVLENKSIKGFFKASYRKNGDTDKKAFLRPMPIRNNKILLRTTPNINVPIIEFDSVTVNYEGRKVLDNMSWTVRTGENWCITGPNGSGKTTILNLITRENLLSYANNIRIFGSSCDSDQSVWELRHKIGVVSPHIHMRYRKPISFFDVIISGFFDSFGLYNRYTAEQGNKAKEIADMLNLTALLERRFTQLSFGEQRLALIARAIVKAPEILILDEPCQGLDPVNRKNVLHAVEKICLGTEVTLLYVSHRNDEIPSCIDHVLRLPVAV